MSLIHQPFVGLNNSSRTLSGCLTPTLIQDETKGQTSNTQEVESKENFDEPSIPSPPLSPYQRPASELANKVEPRILFASSFNSPSRMLKTKEFLLEDYTTSNLNLAPWKNLASDFKKRQFRFLEQYSTKSSKEARPTALRERKINYPKRRLQTSSNSDASDSSDFERVRTRRVVRESSTALTSSSEYPTTPKKKKVRRDPSTYSGSPLSSQVAIDENIPDFCPDGSTLPSNVKCLKTEWKGQPMDLSGDPNYSKLHPAEVYLASILRLPCNVYMDSKKRLFYEKVQRMRKGQQFRRTDAQKACRIDVNKASRLFASFEKVGWLNDSNFVKFMKEDK